MLILIILYFCFLNSLSLFIYISSPDKIYF